MLTNNNVIKRKKTNRKMVNDSFKSLNRTNGQVSCRNVTMKACRHILLFLLIAILIKVFEANSKAKESRITRTLNDPKALRPPCGFSLSCVRRRRRATRSRQVGCNVCSNVICISCLWLTVIELHP
jgi:hypothetical protein